MGEVWIPEAEDLRPAGSSGTMSGVGPPRAIAHVTVSPSGISSTGTVWFDRMHAVLTSKQAEPHLLYDPLTDRLGQYFPLDRSARALMNGGKDISHNKVGTVCIQVEFVAQPDGFTRYWRPGPNFRAMMRAIRSWGIPDQFIGRPASSYSDDVRQSWTTYKERGGWYGHCHVPDPETHWDPGPINTAALFAAAPLTSEEDDMANVTDAEKALLLQGAEDAAWLKSRINATDPDLWYTIGEDGTASYVARGTEGAKVARLANEVTINWAVRQIAGRVAAMTMTNPEVLAAAVVKAMADEVDPMDTDELGAAIAKAIVALADGEPPTPPATT